MVTSDTTALFLFAHPDDEFGVFQAIIDELNNGRRVRCAYMTDGRSANVTAEQRNKESLSVLRKLGVHEEDITFAGHLLSIPDAGLPENLDIASEWLRSWLTRTKSVEAIYVPAWEGGHHDHDSLHAIAVHLVAQIGGLQMMRQFPLYNGYRCQGPWFRVFLPLPHNGTIESRKIPLRNRLRFLSYCLAYPSQMKTWLGLFPFVACHYFIQGSQILQKVSGKRASERPHEGSLYYERRNFYTWEKMVERLQQWHETRRVPLESPAPG